MENQGNLSGEDAGIKHLIDTFINAWNEHDAKLFASVFEDDADHTNVLGIHKKGREEIEVSHKPLFETIWSASTLSPLNISIRHLTSSIASVNLHWRLENIIYPKSEIPAIRQGLIHFVLRKTDNYWKVSIMHNMDLPK